MTAPPRLHPAAAGDPPADPDTASLTALSTAPREPAGPAAGPPGPRWRPTRRARLVRPVRRAWRGLTSMRTALLLLLCLAVAAIPGSLLPQRSLAPARVAQYLARHPALGPALDRLSLFDVFAAPWFAAVYVLLFVSLIGCLAPRIRLHARALIGRPPRAPRHLERLGTVATWTTATDPEQVIAAAAAVLRRRRWRVRVDRADADRAGAVSVAAERGYLRETGNLVFHVSLVVLLVGIAAGSLLGYRGDVLLVQGQGFTNTVPLYDDYSPGHLTHPQDLQPFTLHLDDFRAGYTATGEPTSFHARMTVAPRPGAPARAVDVQVNHPLRFGAAKVYLIGHGYALHAIVRTAAGRAVFDDTVACSPTDQRTFLSSCVIKVADTGLTRRDATGFPQPVQVGVLATLAPTAALDPARGLVSTDPRLTQPRVVLGAFSGDLGLNSGVPQSVYALDTRRMSPLRLATADALVTPGGGHRTPLVDGLTLELAGVVPFATFQVKQDPAKGLTLIAAVGIVGGLLLSLRVRRRRLWVRAERSSAEAAGGAAGSATGSLGAATVVTVGGLARTASDDLSAELARVATAIRARGRVATGPGTRPAPRT